MLMPPIKRKWKKRKTTLLIPGGWQAIVPQVIEDEPEIVTKAWSEYLVNANMAKNGFEANKIAVEMHQNVYNYAWRVLLSQSIFYWAKQYAKRYPWAMRINHEDNKLVYTLDRFNPTVMQHAFVPNQKPGLDGLKFVDAMMKEMWDER